MCSRVVGIDGPSEASGDLKNLAQALDFLREAECHVMLYPPPFLEKLTLPRLKLLQDKPKTLTTMCELSLLHEVSSPGYVMVIIFNHHQRSIHGKSMMQYLLITYNHVGCPSAHVLRSTIVTAIRMTIILL